jgi:hypothetical protein
LSEDGQVSVEPFHRLMPMPRGGLFYTRTEVLLTALTDAVVTCGADGTTWISGSAADWTLPGDLDVSRRQSGRMVAFHFAKFASAQDAANERRSGPHVASREAGPVRAASRGIGSYHRHPFRDEP